VERLETRLDGPILVQPVVHGDQRGFFLESYRFGAFRELGIHDEFVQDNHSRSRRGVVRGMHFQPGQAKLVRCSRGAIVDVLVDVRRGSPTWAQWEAFELDDRSLRELYAPVGFAHGFCVTSEEADVVYKCSSYYDPALEAGFRYDDPDVGIEWPDLALMASDRDAGAPLLSELEEQLPFTWSEPAPGHGPRP
jgi:dTDP-4-dehydrorhamnose 3,5-epimerase